MKILVTIAHFFREQKDGRWGSQKNPEPRISALTHSILSLQQLFGINPLMIQIKDRSTILANQFNQSSLEIVICTTGDNHLIAQIPLPNFLFKHYNTNAEPLFLGLECHRVLQENLDKYDYYCFLEDDLIIDDADFFVKLKWFNSLTSMEKILLPNRYELGLNQYTGKCYIDGDLRPDVTKPFQDVNIDSELKGTVMNHPVILRRPLNPHSGCFFLTNEQLKYWCSKDYFLVKDSSFIGPLESSATLGIMRTFKIYKPAPECANFLEIRHWGNSYMSLLGSIVSVSSSEKN